MPGNNGLVQPSCRRSIADPGGELNGQSGRLIGKNDYNERLTPVSYTHLTLPTTPYV